MNKATLRSILAASLVAAGIGYTGAQLTTATDEVYSRARVEKVRPANDSQVALVCAEAKCQQVADFLDEKFSALCDAHNAVKAGSCRWVASENGMKNLSARVALASSPETPVGRMTQFRIPSQYAGALKVRADAVAGVAIGCVEDCGTDALSVDFPVMVPGLDGGADVPATEDGGAVVDRRPYKSAAEFLAAQNPPLVQWQDPNAALP